MISVTNPLIGIPEIQDDLGAPYTDQISVGLDRELTTNISVGGSYIYKKGGDLIGRIKPYATFTPKPWTYLDRNQQSHEITVYSQDNTDAKGNTLRIINQPKFSQEYQGFVVQANKRMADNWMMLASFTASKSSGMNAGSGSRDPSAQQNSNMGTWGLDPNNFTNSEGILTGDRPYMFKMQGAYQLPWQVQLSGDYQYPERTPHLPGRPDTHRPAGPGTYHDRRPVTVGGRAAGAEPEPVVPACGEDVRVGERRKGQLRRGRPQPPQRRWVLQRREHDAADHHDTAGLPAGHHVRAAAAGEPRVQVLVLIALRGPAATFSSRPAAASGTAGPTRDHFGRPPRRSASSAYVPSLHSTAASLRSGTSGLASNGVICWCGHFDPSSANGTR